MLRTLKFIVNHPFNRKRKVAALFDFFKWQLNSRIVKRPVSYQFTENSKLLVWTGLTGATGNIYGGLHDFEDMSFLLHLLRPDDLFVDVGSNIGSYSILAAAEIGAKTIAIEPVPQTYQHLVKNIELNKAKDSVTALNIGIGSKPGTLKFTTSFDTGNRVAKVDEEFIEVNVDTLDNILAEEYPILLKIDVEGFETEVLNGAVDTLQKASLRAIIIELNGSGLLFGYDDEAIHQKILANGFKAMVYHPRERKLTEGQRNMEGNTLYVRDEEWVADRLKNARKVLVKNQSI